MNNEELNNMIRSADKKYHFSEIEKKKIKYLLEYCHANDVRWTLRQIFEVYFKCDAMPGREITITDCCDECARCGCSTCTAAEDAELLINQEKSVFDVEPADELFFEHEIRSIIQKYHGNKKEKISNDEIELLTKQIAKELKYLNRCFDD